MMKTFSSCQSESRKTSVKLIKRKTDKNIAIKIYIGKNYASFGIIGARLWTTLKPLDTISP